jgi:magnesium-transporting ATPase (P-type)
VRPGVHKPTAWIVKLDRRIKTALDETRLLILGSQVLFGFLLESVFQNAFETLSRSSQFLVCAALVLMVLSIGCLIAPSMQHRIVEAGQSTARLERATTTLAEWGLLPFLASLGLALFIVFERIFGEVVAAAAGIASAALAAFFWFGWAWLIGNRRRKTMAEESAPTPLSTKIEQMLTEARVIIPGCQALLGFQLIAMLTHAFDELPFDAKIMHAAGLCSVAIAMILLMTPAALHREAFGGNDSETFLRLGSAFVISASLPLALGISADVYVVFLKITHSIVPSIVASVALLLAMLVLWYFYPLWLRADRA